MNGREESQSDYDKENDIFSITFGDGNYKVSEEFITQYGQEFVIDFDKQGKIKGIEIFNFKTHKKGENSK